MYDKIHCYLNIPDTSNRDSLFQAEARRCKEIIDALSASDVALNDKQKSSFFSIYLKELKDKFS